MEEIYDVVVKQRKESGSVVPSVEAYAVHTLPVSKVQRVELHMQCVFCLLFRKLQKRHAQVTRIIKGK